MAASTAGMTLCVLLPSTMALSCMIIVGIVSGIASGFMLIKLGLCVSQVDVRSCVAISAVGTIGSSLLFTLFLLFEPFEACIFASSMPLVSAILLQFGMHNLEDQKMTQLPSFKETCAALSGEIAVEEEDPYDEKEWRFLTLKLALCCMLVGISNEVGRTLYVQMGVISIGGQGYALVEAFSALVATIVTAGIALGLVAIHTQRMARNVYHVLILLLVLSALGIFIPAVYGHEAALLPHSLNTASYSCFSMFTWVILGGLCGRHLSKATRMFAFVRAGWAAGPLIGMLLGRFIFYNDIFSIQTAFWIAVLGVVSILVASGFTFSETDLVKAMDLLPTQHRQRFREKCSAVSARFGLSERETQVMELLAKGRNLPYIQEQLLLSKSTVSTHRQHIYAKLDIHSQQELMNIIQEQKI